MGARSEGEHSDADRLWRGLRIFPTSRSLTELVKAGDDAALVKLLSATTAIGRPIFSTPNVPAGTKYAAMRRAFDATMTDPDFVAAAQKAGLDLNPSTGEEVQAIVADMLATPKSVSERLKAIIAGRE